jgi:hypothetical protein
MTRLMDAFPSSREAQVTLANWRTAPYNRWAFHHVRELIPTAEIANDPARVTPLPAAPAKLFDERFLADTDTDGIVALHRGKLVFERYFNGMTAESPHILMSVSKVAARPRRRADEARRRASGHLAGAGAEGHRPTAARRSAICSTCGPGSRSTRITWRPPGRSSSIEKPAAGIPRAIRPATCAPSSRS